MKKLNIKIYSDGANVEAMIKDNLSGVVDGFTTNPTLMLKDGVKDYMAFAKDALSKITDKPISFEVFSDDLDEMYVQALKLKKLASNVYVKIPISNTLYGEKNIFSQKNLSVYRHFYINQNDMMLLS